MKVFSGPNAGHQATREQIYQALFNLAAGIVDANGDQLLRYSSRRWTSYANFPAEQQPSLMQTQGKEKSIVTGLGMPAKWELSPMLHIYTSVGEDPTATPASLMNPILDALDALMPTDGKLGNVTLGGLVYDCRISGEIITDEGTLGSQSVAIVPILITSRS